MCVRCSLQLAVLCVVGLWNSHHDLVDAEEDCEGLMGNTLEKSFLECFIMALVVLASTVLVPDLAVAT